MHFTMKWASALVPTLALAMPAFATGYYDPPSTTLADPDEPGSVIVFPKFINMPAVSVDGALLPRTEIELGAVCPAGVLCAEGQKVKVRLHWVCPGDQSVATKFVCKETDFDVFVNVNGKVAFSADGSPLNSASPRVPAPQCKNGYLIGWAIDNTDRPIKFDGLIGDAVLRGPALGSGPSAGLSTAVEAYTAIAIQADPALASGALIAADTDPATGSADLRFDGTPGHYQAVTGKLYGDVKFDRTTAGGGPSPVNALSTTQLIMLTLDVRSNRPNNPVFVPLQFYNETNSLTSSSWEFLCWTQVTLSQINTNLTQVFQGTRKGVVIAGPAEKDQFIGINDPPYSSNDPHVTLLGLVQTYEGTAANNFMERSYVFSMYNDSKPVRTRFVPFPF
ncbi:MAG: hypothetical protein ACJ8AH_04485 [Stellaceae bacterium]|jgi:hypothetical protein